MYIAATRESNHNQIFMEKVKLYIKNKSDVTSHLYIAYVICNEDVRCYTFSVFKCSPFNIFITQENIVCIARCFIFSVITY